MCHGISGLIDLSHAPLADEVGDVVVAESGNDFQCHGFLRLRENDVVPHREASARGYRRVHTSAGEPNPRRNLHPIMPSQCPQHLSLLGKIPLGKGCHDAPRIGHRNMQPHHVPDC